MKRLNVIPYPNKVVFTGGKTDSSVLALRTFIFDPSMAEEEYTIEINSKGAAVRYSCEKSRFYAEKTLEQLALCKTADCCKIYDKPAFGYRAFMLDTVRHIISLDDTKRFIDAMASVKMNYMHWHLSDDQGFRIELEKHREITEKSSIRKASTFGDEKDYTPYGGYFTKAQIKEIVDYAASKFIEVIPEIDMPGHTTALLHAHPELSCTGKDIDLITKQGVFPDILCAGNEKTFGLVFDLLDEISELFPCRYFHIGGDEAPKKRWKACRKCQEKIKELGLKNEEELQGWFVNRIKDYLAEKGKTAIVWNESLKSGLVDGVTVQYWMEHGKNLSVKYANAGGKVIVSDFYRYYADYPYSMTPLRKCYNYAPLEIGGLTARGRNNIIGVETPIWTEYIRTSERLYYMCFPRFTATAETGWTSEENKDEADFERRFQIYSQLLESLGIVPAPEADRNPTLLTRLKGVLKFFKPVVISSIE